ncbi:hypothetical protein L9F63_027328, partial [Diploptera punctata]
IMLAVSCYPIEYPQWHRMAYIFPNFVNNVTIRYLVIPRVLVLIAGVKRNSSIPGE